MGAADRVMHGQDPAGRQRFELGILLDALYWRSGTDMRRNQPARLSEIVDNLREGMGVSTITALIDRIVHDDRDLQQVHATLTAQLSDDGPGRFADKSEIDDWHSQVLPLLRSTPFPTLWVHDCGDMELLEQLLLRLLDSDLLKRSTVFVTCTDAAQVKPLRLNLHLKLHQVLRLAQQRALPHARRISPTDAAGSIIVAAYNIHTDGTFNEFDFIVCGTALRQLASSAQRRLMRLLADSLASCGVLQLLSPDAADAARIAPLFLPMADAENLYRHALLERHAQQRRPYFLY